LGTVEKGKIADLLVVEGNPVADLKALRKVALVVQNGSTVGGGRLT
jgi:imidazolonepropionase-like amidohydrolase